MHLSQFYEVDEPGAHYTEWSKSEKEKQILYNNAYIYGIEKDGTDEIICRATIETQTQKTDLRAWSWGRKESSMET